jgi:hypothetical protein
MKTEGLYIKIFAFLFLIILFSLWISASQAQEIVHYSGDVLSNVDYHHGQLRPAVGVHNIQVLRANREHPELAEGSGWTYNHAPMLAYWNNTFYLQYLSNPVGEHVPPGQTLLATSKDGIHWSRAEVIFPPYKVPDGLTKNDYPGVAKDLYAVMHQRMGFFVSKKRRLLTLGYYGIALDAGDNPNDGQGVGRVVREIYADGKQGPIYFIRHNSTWDQKISRYPLYTKSKDKGFIEACNELMADPLMMMQWVEESDRNDPLIPLKKEYKAFSYYKLPDSRVVGLWKHALTSTSNDGGKTWPENAVRAPGFVNSNAKIWGQRLADGSYATVYNPSEFRWPLAISTSDDGLNYKDLLLVHGEISPRRYYGDEKSYGPQYVRGILNGNGSPADGHLWVTYSMNKEDIWISRIPVPVTASVNEKVNDVFADMPDGRELDKWNISSPLWAPVTVEKPKLGSKALTLKDSDPYDFAKAERIIPPSQKLQVELSVSTAQDNSGVFHIEFQNGKSSPVIRIVFDSLGRVQSKAGAKFRNITSYKANEVINLKIEINTRTRIFSVSANGKPATNFVMYAPALEIERVVFRTGAPRRFPNAETPATLEEDLPGGGEQEISKVYHVHYLKVNTLPK